MKFIVGLLVGAGLVFGWYYMDGVFREKLNQEREKSKAVLEEVKKTDADILAKEKLKICADYEFQLKAAEDQVKRLNTEILELRTDLVTVRAKLTDMIEAAKVVEKPVSNSVVIAAPVVLAPVAPATPSATVQSTDARPAPKQSVPGTPVQSTFSGPRPVQNGGVVYNYGYCYPRYYHRYYNGYYGNRNYTGPRYRAHTLMDGTVIVSYY